VKEIFKPGSRLIILFILTMIISGVILTFLSITSISNFKELTEKRVSEEQISIAEKVAANFQQELEDITSKFAASALEDGKINWPEIKLCDTINSIEHSFAISRVKGFLWPWFIEGPNVESVDQSSILYMQSLQRAELKEFQERDYYAASVYYKKSLEQALNEMDSAKSINRLARVQIKIGNKERAIQQYFEINSKYLSVIDNNGFPYVYYAILNLIKLSDSTNITRILIELESVLSGLADGTVPLNNSTADILSQITEWRETISGSDDYLNPEMDEYTRIINSRLRFIDEYGSIIRTSLVNSNSGGLEYPMLQKKYYALNGNSGDQGYLLLIDLKQENPVGFNIRFDEVWAGIIMINYCNETEFEYRIELLKEAENNSQNTESLDITADLSEFFPELQIRIGLKDQKLVETYVKRRSWTYGLALLLLLGAMLSGILLIFRDILREKRLSQLRSDFVSNVTHELKTPLTSIHMFTESILLDRVADTSGKKEYLQIVLKETERLKRIINNILDFSKKEKGKIEYRSEEVDVTDLINSALNDLNYWLVEKDFTVDTELEENVIITADNDAIQQVIINLLDNAIKYSWKNKEIRVSLVSDKDKIRMEFEDKGIGIPEDEIKSIFEKFYRVNKTMKDGIGGTGLGLTLVKEIIEAHNGEILVESKLNEGSKFTVLLDSQ